MGVEHALKTIAHRVGSYKDNNSHVANKNGRFKPYRAGSINKR